MPRKTVSFVTGTRAEFGLMRSALLAIQKNPRLRLKIVVTGMHLDHSRGMTLRQIKSDGWNVDAIVPWKGPTLAAATGNAIAGLSKALVSLKTDIVLVVGDRVEALAAATAGHLSQILVAHVHGGDRAQGQVDDALRHAITKLSHIHFPATAQSAQRIQKLGEDPWRIHLVGSPGIDGITSAAASRSQLATEFPSLRPGRFALLLLHPTDANNSLEFTRAAALLKAVASVPFEKIVIVYPNNDPGSSGTARCWQTRAKGDRFHVHRDLARPLFLGLLRDTAVLIGNSSSGIIEAASFGTPVIDIGPRQLGRQRSEDVRHVPYGQSPIAVAAKSIWNHGNPPRSSRKNPYGGNGAGRRIASTLSTLPTDNPNALAKWQRKLITY